MRFKTIIAVALAAGIAAANASASSKFPNKPITLVTPFSAGGSVEAGSRLFAHHVSEKLGVPVLVESRPGGGGAIAGQLVARAKPDGHTLLIVNDGPNASLPAMQRLPYDAVNDFEPITMLWESTLFLTVPASLGVNSVEELIALAKSKKGGLTYGTQARGATGHRAGAMLAAKTGAPLRMVPYGGGAAMYVDLVAGRLGMTFGTYNAVKAYVETGELKILATLSPNRWPRLPDVPTMAEAGVPGLEMGAWWGLAAPKGLPADVKRILNQAFVEASQEPELLARFEAMGLDVRTNTPEEFSSFMTSEARTVAAVIEHLD